MFGSTKTENWFCRPELRDPMTRVYSFVCNPSRLRLTCEFLRQCFDHCIYLETTLAVPIITELLPAPPQSNTTPIMSRTTTTESPGETPDSWVVDGGGSEDSDGMNVPVLMVKLGFVGNKGLGFHLNFKDFKPAVPEEDLQYRLQFRGVDSLPLLENLKLGPKIKQLHISDTPSLAVVGRGAFANCTGLTEVVLESLPQLSEIGDHFLGWSGLVEVRLAKLPQLTTVGNFFLASCPALQEVTLDDVPELTVIGQGWLNSCMRLEKVQCANLPKVKEIGDSWLTNCPTLREATFVELPELRYVGKNWLFGSVLSPAGVKVQMARLPKLEELGGHFLKLPRSCFTATSEMTIGDLDVVLGDECHLALRTQVEEALKTRVENLNAQKAARAAQPTARFRSASTMSAF